MPRGAKRALDARIKIAQPTSRDQQFTHHDVHANCANQIATTNAYTDKCHRPSYYDVGILGPFAHYTYKQLVQTDEENLHIMNELGQKDKRTSKQAHGHAAS